MTRVAIAIAVFAAAGGGCRKARRATVPVVAAAKPGRLVISYAQVRRTRAEPPARFAAALPLPRQWARFDNNDARFPPRQHVTDLIVAGDADMQARWLAALRAAVRQGATEEALRKTWGALLQFESEPGLCAFAARHAVGGEPAPIRGLMWDLLPRCSGPEVAVLFARPDAPGRALLALAGERHISDQPVPPYTKAMADAADKIILGGGDSLEARLTAFTLADLGDPRAVEQLLRLHAHLRNPETRTNVAMALRQVTKDPRAQAIAKAACAAHPDDPVCSSDDLPAPAAASKSLDALATAESIDVEATIGGRRGPEVTAALTACARRNPAVHIRRMCLEKLAVLDRARAVSAAAAVDPGDDADFHELRATLVRFPDATALTARLRAAGIDTAAGERDGGRDGGKDQPPPLVARDYLERSARVHSFDTETDQFPNEHDSLLRALASIAGPRFPRAVFEEIAPRSGEEVVIDSEEDPSDATGPYTLLAYTGGQRLETAARNLGDWYDVAAVLGLLNVIARDAGIDVRFAALSTSDQTSHVVALPEGALRAFAREGLIVFDTAADQGRAQGRAFEEEALRGAGVR